MQYKNPYIGVAANNLTGGKAAIDSDCNIILLDDSAPMPTLEEIRTECERLEQRDKLNKMSRLNADYIQRKEAEAEREAINELIATRKAEILAQMDKETDNSISRARERAETCSRQALALTNQQGEEGLKN